MLPKVFQCIALLQGFCPSSRPLHSFRIDFFSTAFSALFTASAASQRVSLATSSLTFCPCLLSFCNSTWQLCSSFWCFAALLPELPFSRPALICLTSLSIFKILLAVSSLLLLPPMSGRRSASFAAALSFCLLSSSSSSSASPSSSDSLSLIAASSLAFFWHWWGGHHSRHLLPALPQGSTWCQPFWLPSIGWLPVWWQPPCSSHAWTACHCRHLLSPGRTATLVGPLGLF